MIQRFLKLFLILLSVSLNAATEFTSNEKEMLSQESRPFDYPQTVSKENIQLLKTKYSNMIVEYHNLIKDLPAWKEQFPDAKRREAEVYAALLVENFNTENEPTKYNEIFLLDGGIEILNISKPLIINDYFLRFMQLYLENFQKIFANYFLKNQDGSDHLSIIADFSIWLKSIEDKDFAFMILNTATSSAQSVLNNDDFMFLVANNSYLALTDSKSPDVNFSQVNFINNMLGNVQPNNNIVKIFENHSNEDLSLIIEKKKSYFSETSANDVIVYQELISQLVKARNSGDPYIIFPMIEKIEKQHLIVSESLTWKDKTFLDLFNRFLIDGTKNEYYTNTKNFADAKKVELLIFTYIDQLIDLMVENLKTNDIFLGGKDPVMLSLITRFFPYSSLAGNNEKLIDIYKKLIDATNNETSVGFRTVRADLLEMLSREYIRSGDYEKSEKLAAEARKLAFETNQFSEEQLAYHVGYNLKIGNLIEAYVATLKSYSLCLEKTPDSPTKNLWCGQHLEIEKLIIGQIYELHPEYRQIIDNLSLKDKNIFLIDKYNNDESKFFIDAKSIESLTAEVMEVYLTTYDLILISNLDTVSDLKLLKSIEPIFTTYAQFPDQYSNRKAWLAFISKVYINLFINTLTDIKKVSSEDYEKTVENSGNILRNIASILYEVGDYTSLNVLLRLIKENEYSEFIQRNANADISKLALTKEEEIFKKKLKILQKDLLVLEEMKLDSNYLKNYEREMKKKITALNEYINEFNIRTSDKPKDILNNLLLGKNEIQLQYLVVDNNLYLYSTDHAGMKKQKLLTENYRDLRLKVLELNTMINKKDSISENLLNNISNILLPDDIELMTADISHVQLIADDVLHTIPFDILKYKGLNFIDSFSIADYVQSSTKLEIVDDSSLNIFYAQNALVNNDYNFSALPSVDDEAGYIQKYAQNRFNSISIFPNELFDKQSLLKSLSNDGGNIHISTHVKASGSSYEQVVMMLGNKTVVNLKNIDEDLSKSPLNMIVLSACDTADLNLDTQSKVFTGMSTFFHKKGAINVISALWSIDDKATSLFMALLYDIFANNDLDWSTAIKYTKNYFSTGGKISSDINISIDTKTKQQIKSYSHPYYWAAFQISTTN